MGFAELRFLDTKNYFKLMFALKMKPFGLIEKWFAFSKIELDATQTRIAFIRWC